MSARPNGWGILDSRPTAPPSPLTTSSPAGIGKWAPPISKWAKPPKPPVEAESRDKLAPERQNPRAFLRPNRGFGLNPSSSLIQPRSTPAPGKWLRPQGFSPQEPLPKSEGRSDRIHLRREQEPKFAGSSRPFIQPQGDEHAVRQPRRWEGNGKHKTRGSLLFRREGDGFIPRQPRGHEVRATSKPRVQKAKKSLRINPDINIPSTVSVGNFARLLNVSLSKKFGLAGYGVHL